MLSLKKLETILKHLEPILKAENDDLKEDLGDKYTDDDKDLLVEMVESYEKKMRKALNKEKKRVIKYAREFVGKDITVSALLAYILKKLNEDTSLEDEIKEINLEEYTANMEVITPLVMDLLDKDVSFNHLSKRTITWIEEWSEELGEIMKLTTVEGVERALKKGLEDGVGIKQIEEVLANLPEFSRDRARATAITEVLTAHSASQYEAYSQSPVVVGKVWKHSGGRGINPRDWHARYSGTEVGIDDPFVLDGEEGMYPRDPAFGPRNRVRCHCAMGPVTDSNLLKKTPKQKQKLHEKRMKELDK